ncbi:KamA family radical SAM protein [Desulfitobacterium metallireducens]|uniref:Lysine 2,3-aminomutase n=1 Tax=Desulfitobacterium metallireducens DSM 15288 TaxID=871968 RepID=W0EAQ6_9FIRM|nr:KamA family radical SAM protein [Desulfitobacterium metallireducens]AHF06141.1 lysine 2,3-aminomutase [Desulfitobacterium metallireducens DSM 15288]
MDESLQRSAELLQYIQPFMKEKEHLNKAQDNAAAFLEYRNKILTLLNASPQDFDSWKWQLSKRFTSVDLLSKILPLKTEELAEIEESIHHHRMAISPFLLTRLASCGTPLSKQFLPSALEILNENFGELDPMAEEKTSPVPHVTQRYPDRVILKVTNICGSYCRFCQRRREHGCIDLHVPSEQLEPAFDYITKHPEIRDILVTGGDPLTLSDRQLDQILQRLRQIPSVEMIRIGTRMPIVIPQRITPALTKILRKYAPIYINLHVNHPLEVSPEMKEACRKLFLSGAILGSQTVLLKDINDNPMMLRYLFQLLLSIGIKPYYLFHAKDIAGTRHFRTPVEQGVNLVKSLRGVTSGLAIPHYVVNLPGGLGKVALAPQVLVNGFEDNPLLFTNWEGKTIPYPNHD